MNSIYGYKVCASLAHQLASLGSSDGRYGLDDKKSHCSLSSSTRMDYGIIVSKNKSQ